ncbi:signal peptidase I [Streptomyces sp. TRM66268-LWL]|uniref:Signal peptidase I n=1 Tax=Streptomyces polyasparticus TaxID=2767826 RepID=A0ABR7S8A7_9ACTN|nr:signal peptidase I [Streptomyces polyasparticus]MBC9711663.1 signal peptidase I [Streptomyces polyasparticus]
MSRARSTDQGSRLGSTLSGIAVALGCVLFLGGFVWGALVYQPYTVPTGSMSPTIQAGQRVLAQRIEGDEVKRGDVVVFKEKDWGDLPMVKRVVAVGGDKITCCDADGRMTVNGKAIEEPYLPTSAGKAGTNFPPTTVPKGRIFLLGDDRAVSLDSSAHLEDAGNGAVPLSGVDARVEAIAWPMDGMLPEPSGFKDLPGGISEPGPLGLMLTAVVAGAVLVMGGAAYGPIAKRAGRRGKRPAARREPAGAR